LDNSSVGIVTTLQVGQLLKYVTKQCFQPSSSSGINSSSNSGSSNGGSNSGGCGSSRLAGKKIVPSRSHTGWLTPTLPAALHCCQFFPQGTASHLVAHCLSKDCRRHGNGVFIGSDRTIFMPATPVVAVAVVVVKEKTKEKQKST
jgi:hypothetical protein